MGNLKIETYGSLHDMTFSFSKASKPLNVKNENLFNATFDAAAAAVEAKVHVETGILKGSGRADTHVTNDQWQGEIRYKGHPGVFELARGDMPTKTHPEGGHFFFNAVEPFFPGFDEDINEVFRSYFEENAPI